MDKRLCAKELRALKEVDLEKAKKISKNPIYIIVDDVWDTYNIGAIFRLSDAVAAEKVFLCRGTETPPNSRIKKASINTWQWVNWEYCKDTKDAINELRQEVPDVKIVAVELIDKSIPYDEYDYPLPIALVVGNETHGVSQDVLDMCDVAVQLPMFGINISLNVMVSLGIVLYEAIEKNKIKY